MNLCDKLEQLTEEQKKFVIFKCYLDATDQNNIAKLDEMFSSIPEKKLTYLSVYARTITKLREDIVKNQLSNVCYEKYKSVLNKFSKLVSELHLTNSLEVANLYSYLLWNGYFSVTKNNQFKMEDRKLTSGLYSYDIFRGIGVCLNHSEMLKDYLNECGIYSSTVINLADKKMETDYVPQIERDSSEPLFYTKIFDKILSPLSHKIGNHAINLINENGMLYLYDSTNFLFLKLIDNETAEVVNGKGKFKLNSYFSYFINLNEMSMEPLDTLNTNTKFECPYSRKDFIFEWENCIELFDKNKKLFEDCRNDSYNDMVDIVNSIQKVKKR